VVKKFARCHGKLGFEGIGPKIATIAANCVSQIPFADPPSGHLAPGLGERVGGFPAARLSRGSRFRYPAMCSRPGEQSDAFPSSETARLHHAARRRGGGAATRAAPDGYTLLLHQMALATAMTFYPNLAFDAEKDFVTIGLVNTAATTIAARPTFRTSPEDCPCRRRLVQPFVRVLFAQEVGAKADQIPYRGAGPAPDALIGGGP
jgi:Tripartite tricarboxylate transporter family receptor